MQAANAPAPTQVHTVTELRSRIEQGGALIQRGPDWFMVHGLTSLYVPDAIVAEHVTTSGGIVTYSMEDAPVRLPLLDRWYKGLNPDAQAGAVIGALLVGVALIFVALWAGAAMIGMTAG